MQRVCFSLHTAIWMAAYNAGTGPTPLFDF